MDICSFTPLVAGKDLEFWWILEAANVSFRIASSPCEPLLQGDELSRKTSLCPCKITVSKWDVRNMALLWFFFFKWDLDFFFSWDFDVIYWDVDVLFCRFRGILMVQYYMGPQVMLIGWRYWSEKVHVNSQTCSHTSKCVDFQLKSHMYSNCVSISYSKICMRYFVLCNLLMVTYGYPLGKVASCCRKWPFLLENSLVQWAMPFYSYVTVSPKVMHGSYRKD